MDFNFSSFLGGAATAVTNTIEEETKNARAIAAAGTKALHANYSQTVKENREMSNEILDNYATIKQYKPEATRDQLLAIASNKSVMDAFMSAMKDKYFDPNSLDMNVFAKIIGDNEASPGTAAEKVAAAFAIPKIATTVAAAPDSAETGNYLRDLINKKAKNAGDATAAQTAAALGTTIEQLKGAQTWTKPDFTKGVQFDMSLLKPPLSTDEQIEEAKRRGIAAEKKGDTAGVSLANAELLVHKKWKELTNSDQENFANETARIKHEYLNAKDPAQMAAAKVAYDRLVEPVRSDAQKLADKIAIIKDKAIFGTLEEKKAAEPALQSLYAQERREAQAKHIKADKPAEDKIPAISSLASHTSNSVALAVAARYGNLLKDDLILETDAQGNGTFKYVGTDAAKRKEIYSFMAATAAKALSPWTDLNGKPLNTNVGAVLDKYIGASGNVPTEPPPAQAPARGGSSPLPTRGAAPALSQQDQDALAWATANPTDPRSAAIKKRLGQ